MADADADDATSVPDVDAIVERFFADRDLVVVSNREPYSHDYVERAGDGDGGADGGGDGADDADDDSEEVECSRPAGGLTAALDPVMGLIGGTWVAWGSGDADRAVVDEDDHVGVPPDDPAYDLRRVWLDDEDLAGYYYGFSNQVLWPLCHGLPSKVRYEESFWERYRAVNEQFARAVADEVDRPNSVVWFHDYHFGLAPRLVRSRLDPQVLMAHFWHIPWPPYDVFRRCPRGEEVLTALLHNDLVGVHTDRDRRQFVECARSALGATYDRSTGAVTHDGGRTLVRTAPIAIDADAVERRARSDEAAAFRDEFVAEHGLADVRVLLGVDRLDYTKGIEERLDAYAYFLSEFPEYRGEVALVQKASESRSRIDEYAALQRRVEDRIAEIDDRFGTDDWRPVVYVTDHLSQAELGGLYRRADVAVVSPIRDGLNLVAKEYVASQVDEDGVLVLGEQAGVAESLGEHALTINPLDVESFGRTLRWALELGPEERRRRMRALRDRVAAESPQDWVEHLTRDLASIPNDRYRDAGVPDAGGR